MAVRYLGTADAAGPKAPDRSQYVGASSGGTLAGSQKVQIVFDDSVYVSTQDGKQRLLDAIQSIMDHIATAKTWPIDSTS